MVLGEERWLLRFQILGPYPKPTDSAYLEWELAFLKQASRWILSALDFNRHGLIAIPPSFLGPLPYTSEFLRLWLISLNGSVSLDPWRFQVGIWSIGQKLFPYPTQQCRMFFSRLAQRKGQSLFSFWLIGDSLATNIPLCAFSLLQGLGRAAEKLLEGGLGGTQRKIIRTATPSVIKS